MTTTPGIKIEYVPLTILLLMRHDGNPKNHDLGELAASFARFGFTMPPAIDEASHVMIVGHGRCEALARLRNAGEPPPLGINVADGDWLVPVIRGLAFKNKDERDAYLISDNAHTMLGGWNLDALGDMLYSLQPIGLEGIGLDQEQIDAILNPGEDDDDKGSDGREVEVTGHTRVIGGHKVRPPVQMTNDDWTLIHGDCIAGMRLLDDCSVDAVVTDPPAGISFMAKGWDDDKGGRDHWIAWLASVMREALRVLKPGGHALVWALPRTSHWTATAIENAGFEIRDIVYHAFGTGFPKSLDVSKAIDAKLGAEREIIGEQPIPGTQLQEMSMGGTDGSGMANGNGWTGIRYGGPVTAAAAALQGWGTALKPAVEPWIMARKPLEGTVAETVLKYGTGALNIDGCRIGDEMMPVTKSDGTTHSENFSMAAPNTGRIVMEPKQGRWPAHLVMTHSDGCVELGQVADQHAVRIGEKTGDDSRALDFGMGTQATTTTTTTTTIYRCVDACPIKIMEEQSGVDERGLGASRFFYCGKPSRNETEAGLQDMPTRSGGGATGRADGSKGIENPRAGAGRGGGRANYHPTKKPIALMRWMVRLITPPRILMADGDVVERSPLVLDMFAGSGTTGLGALAEGCRFIGFEKEAEYHAIAEARLRSFIEDPRDDDTPELPEEEAEASTG